MNSWKVMEISSQVSNLIEELEWNMGEDSFVTSHVIPFLLGFEKYCSKLEEELSDEELIDALPESDSPLY